MTTGTRQSDPHGGAEQAALADLLAQQETLFLRLDALSKRQSRLVRDEETDELLRVLGERQSVVDALDRLSAAAAPYRARWEEILVGCRPEQRERIRTKVRRLAELAAEVASRDDADRRTIEQRRDRLADDLAGVRHHRGAVAAYGPARSRPEAKFQDTEG